MNRILTRMTAVALAALLLITAVACSSGPDPADDSGYILNQSNTETPENEITAFYNGNKGTLTALAGGIVKDYTYVAYSYSYRMLDYEQGTISFFVQKQTQMDGPWAPCDEKAAMRLTDVKFVGTVNYLPGISKDVVLITPRMASDTTFALAYCTSEAGKDALLKGKYHRDATVTLSRIEGNWYCVEVAAPTAD